MKPRYTIIRAKDREQRTPRYNLPKLSPLYGSGGSYRCIRGREKRARKPHQGLRLWSPYWRPRCSYRCFMRLVEPRLTRASNELRASVRTGALFAFFVAHAAM